MSTCSFTHKCALFVKEWSSVAKGKCMKRHGVPDNKLEAFSDLNESEASSKKTLLGVC